MANSGIKIEYTPKDLPRRFARWPRKVDREIRRTMEAALIVAQESIPPYPSRRSSIKKGTAKQRRYFFWALKKGLIDPDRKTSAGIGGSLGVSQSGQRIGKSSIWYVRKLGGANYEGAMGTDKKYAQYVIGEGTQARMHQGNWWTFKQVKRRAKSKIQRLFADLMEDLAQYLEGKGT